MDALKAARRPGTFAGRALRLGLAALACLLTTGAMAQQTVSLGGRMLTLTHDELGLVTRFSDGRQQIAFESGSPATVKELVGNAGLIETYTGGTACPAVYFWLFVESQGLRASEGFGTCSDLAAVQMTDQGPMVTMPRLNRSGIAGYVLRDGRIVEHELGLAAAAVAAPSNAAAWAGRSSYDVLHAAELEPILLTLVPWTTLEELRQASTVSADGMTRDGDWYAAIGCMPRQCDTSRAGVAISTRDGRVILAQWTRQRGGLIFGTPDSALPNKFRILLAGQF